MKKNYQVYQLLLWLCLCPVLALAQKDSLRSNQIKLSVEQLINPINWGIKAGYEKRYASDKLSTEIGGTMLLPTPGDFTQKGFRIHLSERFFYRRKRIHQYIGLGYEYQNSTFSDVAYFTDSTLAEWPSGGIEDQYNGKKELYIVNLLWGFQVIKKRFVFDFGVGIGVKYRRVKHSNRDFPEWEMTRPRHPNLYYLSTVESSGFHFNFPLSVKIGYVF